MTNPGSKLILAGEITINDFDTYKPLDIQSLDAVAFDDTSKNLTNGVRILFTDANYGIRGAECHINKT